MFLFVSTSVSAEYVHTQRLGMTPDFSVHCDATFDQLPMVIDPHAPKVGDFSCQLVDASCAIAEGRKIGSNVNGCKQTVEKYLEIYRHSFVKTQKLVNNQDYLEVLSISADSGVIIELLKTFPNKHRFKVLRLLPCDARSFPGAGQDADFKALPAILMQFTSLEELSICGWNGHDFPKIWMLPARLKHFSYRGKQVGIPKEVAQMKHLTGLDVSSEQSIEIPQWLSQLPSTGHFKAKYLGVDPEVCKRFMDYDPSQTCGVYDRFNLMEMACILAETGPDCINPFLQQAP
ncbi:MAG: hypothetical protein Alpg2KO_28430 [Alphaproteobacteria bacterium]